MGQGRLDRKLDRGGKTGHNNQSRQNHYGRRAPSMAQEDVILVGKGQTAEGLRLDLANRHGLIAGATGTGKTVSLQVLAEGFSCAGVPVFMADVKGDLSGISQAATLGPKLQERAALVGLADYRPQACPTVFWDLFGEQGHPIRTTISEMGPLLLARLLGLNETQADVLQVAFRVADDQGLLLLDLKDLRALLHFVGERAQDLSLEYGRLGTASVTAIQRRLLTLEQQGAEHFFGEPALDIRDLMRTDRSGQGIVNVLAADQLMLAPKLYATFLLWLLSELYEVLPEVGDPPKPKLVFFFDEAHLLFEELPKALHDKVEQVVRLIRSKGVGVYFISQNPLDIPDDVLGQLGNRIQHALRAFTPRDQKAIRAAAETFRANPALDTATAITELAVGEALVSLLQDKGVPGVVDRTMIRPPGSRIGPATPEERRQVIGSSPVAGRYDQTIDRESAYEVLKAKAAAQEAARTSAPAAAPSDQVGGDPRRTTRASGGTGRETAVEAMVKSVARSIGSQVGRQIVRGLLGSLLRR
jgi:DNA helicase HerA-like ATPase